MLVVTLNEGYGYCRFLGEKRNAVTSLHIQENTSSSATQIRVFRVAVLLTLVTFIALVMTVLGYDQKFCQDENLSVAFNSNHSS
jgi:hypothetical protein